MILSRVPEFGIAPNKRFNLHVSRLRKRLPLNLHCRLRFPEAVNLRFSPPPLIMLNSRTYSQPEIPIPDPCPGNKQVFGTFNTLSSSA